MAIADQLASTVVAVHINQPEVVWCASRIEVLHLCLPSHATHKTKPLHCMVFSSLNAQ